MRLLLISNSTNAGEEYLAYPKEYIKDFLGTQKVKALFIPYAGIMVSYDDYEKKVRDRFSEIGHDIVSVHHFADPVEAVNNSQAIVVGGGNTFRLLQLLYKNRLVEAINKRVNSGVPYIGWSAGANITCPSISTTNDMPVVQPDSFAALNLVPFQINPHYLDANPDGHAGETREMRISEFLEIQQSISVVGLREGSILQLENSQIRLHGPHTMRVFKHGSVPVEIGPEDDTGLLI
ncbi:MAG: dipeptidase PepE [bacterium]